MGAKDSKPCFLTYEDAVKRVTDAELKRLKDAFKRSSTLNGYMTKQVFVREVLGDGVPAKLSERMFLAFGGSSKGLSFKDLVCGLVLLTRGRRDEKIKFLFGIYAHESLLYIQKEEMDRLILTSEGQAPQCVSQLFLESDRVSYDHFRMWVLSFPEATSPTRWLLQEPCSVTLSNDLETPTFYQTLAGVTHLEETDITELEKRYWNLKAQSRTGRFDLETFKPNICPSIPEQLCEGVFNAFDENRDNHIDFKEMACGISACCRGPLTERQKFCFKVFDQDQDSLLNRKELEEMIEAMMIVREQNTPPHLLNSDGLDKLEASKVAGEILKELDGDKDGCITCEEYQVWTVNHPLPGVFLDLLFQVCHVVLGLKPLTKEDEGKVISGWLEREDRRGLQTGQVWYLVTITWWRQWVDYVMGRPTSQYLPDGTLVNGKRDKSHSRTGSLCRNLGRKSSIGLEDSGTVIATGFNPITNDATGSPAKHSSLGRDVSPHCSPYRTLSSTMTNGDSVTNSPNHSRTTTPSPSPSPKMGKKVIPPIAQRPGAIDNTGLIYPNASKVTMLTNEGGRLKRDKMLIRGRDFELVPETVWKALSAWYGGSPALPRSVITPSHGDGSAELELYPVTVRLLRHQSQPNRTNQVSSFTGMMGGMGGMAVTTAGITHTTPATPRRYLAYLAAFSRKHTMKQVYEFLSTRLRINREDLRIWKFKDEQNMTLLEEEDFTIEDATVEENQQLLIEVRNKDLTWPEEMSQLAKTKASADKTKQVPTQRGATGLNNLGNTCFMNSSLQCVSNTKALTLYFNGGLYLYEINRTNPLGMKGHLAQRYGELVKDLWAGTSKSIAPLKFRWTIGKYAPRFNGFQQHDSQELLAFLLDGLHEDLNRVHDKPYVELKDSDGRPDEIVAKEAWDNHLLRNRSIVVDLFHGQLKSCVRCLSCGHTSVRFDPFTYLSLPLPMDSCIHVEVLVMRLDGSMPIKYGLRLSVDEKYKALKKHISILTSLPVTQILLSEVLGAVVKSLPDDNQKIKTPLGGALYAYELPPVPEIQPMTVLEEKGLSSIQRPIPNGGLSQIQRMHHTIANQSPGRQGLPPINTPNSPKPNGNAPNGSLPNHSNLDSRTADRPQSPLPNGGQPSGHNRQNSSSSSSTTNGTTTVDTFDGFVIALHRKMIRMDVYFLSSQKSRPSLFGTPLILPCDESTTGQDLYGYVWTQVSRLVSPLPPSESNTPNHAQDCDDSLGYEYPFALKIVQKDGFTCAKCPWFRFCRGCKLECNDDPFNFSSAFIAVDWEPTALHLRYQTSQERTYQEHMSVEESRRLQTEPIDLNACLKSFTREEELGEDELYYCSKCKKHRLAAKKLEIWKLPPVLIIHLKRFQFLNNRWVKSHKIVKFPTKDFDPRSYLAQRTPQHKLDSYLTQQQKIPSANNSTNHNRQLSDKNDNNVTLTTANQVPASANKGSAVMNGQATTFKGVPGTPQRIRSTDDVILAEQNGMRNHSSEDDTFAEDAVDALGRCSGVTTELIRRPRLVSESEDYTNVSYDLYAMSCHTGMLGGGHYVAYSKNQGNAKWYCYNDSSCKEVQDNQIDYNSAYMLFYERRDIDYGKFMPDINGKEPDVAEIDDEFESDFKKMCTIQ